MVLQILLSRQRQLVFGRLQLLAVETVVFLAIRKLFANAGTHFNYQIISVYGQVVLVEERVQVGAQQQAIADNVGAGFGIGLNVRGVEHGQVFSPEMAQRLP